MPATSLHQLGLQVTTCLFTPPPTSLSGFLTCFLSPPSYHLCPSHALSVIAISHPLSSPLSCPLIAATTRPLLHATPPLILCCHHCLLHVVATTLLIACWHATCWCIMTFSLTSRTNPFFFHSPFHPPAAGTEGGHYV
jgi:hypothetical protein